MSQRKEVTVTIDESVSFYDILDCNSPDEVIQQMEHYKELYKGRKINFSIKSYGYDGGSDLVLTETRLETDQEYNKRLKAEQKDKERLRAATAKTDERDRKEYLRLKKKFEGSHDTNIYNSVRRIPRRT